MTTLIAITIVAGAAVFLLVRSMHRLSLRAQFLVLIALGISIGFIFLMIVQMPSIPHWLGILLVTVVFVASLFGTRIFLRSLAQEEREETNENHEPPSISHESDFSNVRRPGRNP
jgi:protein-S-isoprenylcysteine O-methyltransferase Ste14